jgi:hypothetical protein
MVDRDVLEQATKTLTDEGKLIEAGWVGYQLAVMSPDAPALQLDECKLAFFAGALHLFSSIMTILDAGAEPTDNDLARLDNIQAELGKFGKDFESKIKKENA